ncbi:MAG: hypothetical protein KGM98_02680 [Bacteroidota bacterium]|nr:hypothetical protein [Bacteroidota bacterium]
MKYLFLVLLILNSFWVSVAAQEKANVPMEGSWINANLAHFYLASSQESCEIQQFGDRQYLPLYLSFINDKQLQITERIEQPVRDYHIQYTSTISLRVFNNKVSHNLFLQQDTLFLSYFHNRIPFVRVSAKYSNDVFGNFILNLIFEKNKRYSIAFNNGGHNWDKKIITIRNFQLYLKKFFKATYVEFVQLGGLRYHNSCVPEIALYNKEGTAFKTPPTVLGIIIENHEIKFIKEGDEKNILTLKPVLNHAGM